MTGQISVFLADCMILGWRDLTGEKHVRMEVSDRSNETHPDHRKYNRNDKCLGPPSHSSPSARCKSTRRGTCETGHLAAASCGAGERWHRRETLKRRAPGSCAASPYRASRLIKRTRAVPKITDPARGEPALAASPRMSRRCLM